MQPARRSAREALLAALLCLVGLVVAYLITAHVPAARVRDAAALRGFVSLGHPTAPDLASIVLALVNPWTITAAVLVAMAVAIRRGRPRVALAVPVIVAGSVFSAEVLKPLLAVPHDFVLPGDQIVAASWPSGHSTAAMSMALAAVLVAPRRMRPVVATIGGILVLAVGFSLLILAWHMPSDVIGGFLLSGLWTSTAVAAVRAVDARHPPRTGRAAIERAWQASSPGRTLPLLGLLCLAVAVAVLLATHPLAFADAHRSVVAFAVAITVVAATIVGALTALLRR